MIVSWTPVYHSHRCQKQDVRGGGGGGGGGEGEGVQNIPACSIIKISLEFKFYKFYLSLNTFLSVVLLALDKIMFKETNQLPKNPDPNCQVTWIDTSLNVH